MANREFYDLILWNTMAKAIRAEVRAIDLEDTYSGEKRELKIDGAFIFIGFDPNNQLVPAGTRMNADGCVVTDNKCETKLDAIFAIGDLREKYARQIVPSAADGCTAALAAAHYVEVKRSAGP
jgi:thioredoxin reductase (NADPH)